MPPLNIGSIRGPRGTIWADPPLATVGSGINYTQHRRTLAVPHHPKRKQIQRSQSAALKYT